MPNIKSQKKRARTNLVRAAAVKSEKTKIKDSIKKVRTAIDAKDTDAAKVALSKAYSTLDASVTKGIHDSNYVQRHKSRLTKAVSKMSEPEKKAN